MLKEKTSREGERWGMGKRTASQRRDHECFGCAKSVERFEAGSVLGYDVFFVRQLETTAVSKARMKRKERTSIATKNAM